MHTIHTTEKQKGFAFCIKFCMQCFTTGCPSFKNVYIQILQINSTGLIFGNVLPIFIDPLYNLIEGFIEIN